MTANELRLCAVADLKNKTLNYIQMQNEETEDQITTEAAIVGNTVLAAAVKSDWDLRKYFEQLRFDKNHHLGLGDIRLTIAQQEEICELVERFYRCR